MAIFNSYVSLPEGTHRSVNQAQMEHNSIMRLAELRA